MRKEFYLLLGYILGLVAMAITKYISEFVQSMFVGAILQVAIVFACYLIGEIVCCFTKD